ncbi:hypothetical protein [Aquimarina algicola]|uniref:Bacteriocin n=1 Tax=Aquimarina algicola TaxID=2589995 RepID=A0A504JD33_9FLAO|nr:hypothetical protein [Aquimarina algicola]TPN88926.1 hypothetical protein FHK87_01540 [Aquimarina algicola]
MKNSLLKLGTVLTKNEQQNIKGGGRCDGYTGPIVVTCEQYNNLPDQYKFCVLVSVDCFEQ